MNGNCDINEPNTRTKYSYDAVGNRLSSSGVPSYGYNSSNELTSNSSGSYTYDANGNTLSDASGKSYTWDFENRMVSAVVPGTGTVRFKYDPFGRRVQKSGPNTTINYLYEGAGLSANIIEAVGNSGNILARYTQGPGTDKPLAELRFGATSYYEQDGLGSVSSLSNSAAALADTYSYDSFGEVTGSTGTTLNFFQYTGRENDPETSLDYYRLRYYDPSSGRFLSEDFIAFDGGINFYDYVKNRPTNKVDPFGMAASGGSSASPPSIPNPIPNAISNSYAAYVNCLSEKTKSKICEEGAKMAVADEQPTNQDAVSAIFTSLADAFNDCLCEYPLAVYYPGFNDTRAGKACGSLPWWEDWLNE
jgi:RHS repeat-associated protein